MFKTRRLRVVDMVTSTGLTKAQLKILTAPTPEEDVLSRPGGGFDMSYVTGEYVKRTMLEVFGAHWRYDLLKVKESASEVVVTLALEYPVVMTTKNGSTILEEMGRIVEVGTASNRGGYGGALKSALTDALKRAATHLGIGLDLYHKTQESKAQGKKERQKAKAEHIVYESKPAAVKVAEEVLEKQAAPQPSSFGTDSPASNGQKGFIMNLMGNNDKMGDSKWLSDLTGIPLERIGKSVGKKNSDGAFDDDVLPISKNEAKSIIDILKELNLEE